MTSKATMTRKYPELEVGSQVQVLRKRQLPKKNAVRIGIENQNSEKNETKLGKIFHFGW